MPIERLLCRATCDVRRQMQLEAAFIVVCRRCPVDSSENHAEAVIRQLLPLSNARDNWVRTPV